MKNAEIPSSWLTLGSWTAEKLIRLREATDSRGIDPNDLTAVRKVYVELRGGSKRRK